jgi:hypothetical protein
MKSLIALASVVAFCAAPAFAAEGQLSSQALAKMGLPGMKAMSDEEGMGIRGLSAAAGGFSLAEVQGGSASSQYFAGGHSSAKGFSVSAGAVVTNYNVNFIAAGGFSAARSN